MIKIFLPIFILFFFSEIIIAQDISGNIEGMVADSLGTPLPGVNISVQSENLQGLKGTATNEKGYFSIFYLPVGNYKVKISMIGFRELSIENVQVRLGKTTYLGNLKLSQEAINLPEVTVSGERNIIDPTSTTYGGNIQPKYFDNLPVDRDYKSMITLLPQANTSFYGDGVNVGGATGFENKYFVDGVEVTDPLFGTSGMNLPYNFIQEVELKAGGYETEYRSSLGGLVNVVTYSGTNDFHGSVFGFSTSNNFTDNSKLGLLDPTQGDFTKYDFGFNLRGPIIIDKLWFNVAYNPAFENHDVEIPDFGTYVDKTIVHSFASKLTWNASPQFQIILAANGDPSSSDGVGAGVIVPPDSMTNPDRYFQDFSFGTQSYSLKGIYGVNSNLQLNTLVARVSRNDTGKPTTEEGNNAFYKDKLTNTWSGGTGGWYDSYRYSTIANVSVTHSFNTYILSAGIEYKVSAEYGQYEYHNIYKENETTYWEEFGVGLPSTVSQRLPSFFIQDLWMVTSNLRFFAGIRWDGQYIVGSNNEVDQTISYPLQPRIGITFIPDNEERNKIFASFGRYAQELSLIAIGGHYDDQGYDSIFFYPQDPRISRDGAWYAPWSRGQHIINPEVENLEGQYYDEFSLGYERLIGWSMKASIQGVYRTLRQAFDDVWLTEEERYQYGNPGSGLLSEWPIPQRDYTALILTIERSRDEHFNFLASYVLSRDYGNYEGLFNAFNHSVFPNENWSFDDLNTANQNATGLVPNDRTHVFKFSGSYRFTFGLITGISFIAQSGTPLSELEDTGIGPKFLSPRGSAGRTPAIWDLNARVMYELDFLSSWQSKLILDVFHIASQNKPVDNSQLKYRYGGVPHPNYGKAFRYQPSLSVRIGMEITF